MVRRYMALLVFGAVGAALTFGHTVNAWQSDPIIALERGALDRWVQGGPWRVPRALRSRRDVFRPHARPARGRPGRHDGAARADQGTFKADGYEMIAPKVHRAGTMAVLTYNLVSRGRGPDGKAMVARWNSTAVYAQVDGRWKIVHSHWSFTQPQLKAP